MVCSIKGCKVWLNNTFETIKEIIIHLNAFHAEYMIFSYFVECSFIDSHSLQSFAFFDTHLLFITVLSFGITGISYTVVCLTIDVCSIYYIYICIYIYIYLIVLNFIIFAKKLEYRKFTKYQTNVTKTYNVTEEVAGESATAWANYCGRIYHSRSLYASKPFP